MTLTPAARQLASDTLVAMEGLRLTAYKDGGGVPTIGIGSTIMPSGRPVRMGDVLSRTEALDLLDDQIHEWAIVIDRVITVDLLDAWVAMLVSFVHQEGPSALRGSVLADMLNAKLFDRAGRQLNGWVIARVNGVRQPVLGIERRMEAQRRVALGQPLEPTRTTVWGLGDVTLRPLYTAACADALAYRNGVAIWETVPATVPTHPSTATSARLIGPLTKPVAQASGMVSAGQDDADALMETELSTLNQGA